MGVFTTASTTFAVGDQFTAAWQNNNVKGLIDGFGAWTTYTPTISGTGWAIGNGTTTASYLQVGKLVHYSIQISWGSTSTFGAGQLGISLPVAHSSAHLTIGTAMYITAASANWPGFTQIGGGASILTCQTGAQPTVSVISSAPFAWAASCLVRANGTYESA